jgi:hypothetical protein
VYIWDVNFVAKKESATMKPEDRTLLETHVLGQITSVEQEIAKLTAERDTLRDILLRVRRENSSLRDVTRKNSFDRILIENRVMNILRSASKPVKSQRLYWAALEISARLRGPTFRSYLHRLKSKGLIESETHGLWTAVKPSQADAKSSGPVENMPLPTGSETRSTPPKAATS